MATAKTASVNCPLCERNYPLSEALLHSSFLCMNCGTLIRASAILQPGSEQVSARAARDRDTQPISRADTTEIERADVVPPRRQMDPLDLSEIGNDAIDRPAVVRRKKPQKGMSNLTKASVVAVGGAVAILAIVVTGMLINKALDGPPVAKLPGAPAAPAAAVAKEVKLETPGQRDRRIAWEQAERLVGEIAANKKEVIRLQNALREATTKHFSSVQRELEAARAKGKDLVDQEARWRGEYARLTREMER